MTKGKTPQHPRDGAGSGRIENPADGTAIRTMLSLGEHLLVVTDRCTYRMQMADQIDPERKNPNLPFTTQQKLFDRGFGSETLARTLLQGEKFFKPGFLEIDHSTALKLTLEAAQEIIAMEDMAGAFRDRERRAMDALKAKPQNKSSFVLPTLGDVRGDCRAFIQKADHFSAGLLSIVRLYLPEMKSEGWSHLLEVARKRYAAEPGAAEYVESILPTFQLMRSARDCLDHRLNGVTTRDFSATADGEIARPDIEINFRKSKFPQTPVSEFMEAVSASFLHAFEQMLVMLSGLEVKPFAGMPIVVDRVPDNYRQNWGCRYSYGMIYADGSFVPMS